jgi:outer membrane receptor protein involved in Fe transport
MLLPLSSRVPASLALLLAGLAPALSAQTAPVPSAATTEATTPATPGTPAKKPAASADALAAVPRSGGDEVIDLSPFEVKGSAEDRWNASSTLLGNRTNQELINLPMSVEVLTRDFMDSVGITNMEDAASFVAGISATPRLEARNDNGRIVFRGLSGSSNTSRNFFQWSVPSDYYNVERFDFGKGSNSLMFGNSTPGGQVTTTTKRARFSNLAEAQVIGDNFGSYRFQFDVNRKLTKQLAVRLNAVNRQDKSWIRNSYQRFRAADLSVVYRPFRDTVISVEGERGSYQRRRADNTAAIRDVAAAGRSFSSNNRWYYTSDGEIVQRTNTTPPLATDRSGTSGNIQSLLEGQSVGVRLPNGSQKVFKGFARDFNLLGFGDYLDRPFNVVTAMVEQNIGKLSLQFSYNQQFQHQDRNDNSFGGSATPPVIDVDGSGRPYIDMGGNLTAYKIFGNVFKAGRVSALYPFDFGRWGKQYLVLTGTRSRDYAYNRRFGLSNTAAAGLAANNAIQFRAYLDDPAILDGNGWSKFLVPNLPRSATFTPEIVESYVNTGPFIDIRYTSNYTASLSGEYFGGRLMSLVGISYNRISRKVPIEAAYVTDARGRITFTKTPEEAPEYFTYDPNFSLSAKSLTAGLNYAVFKSDSYTNVLYGSYTESFNWQSQLIFTGRSLGPITGTTREFGIKNQFLQRRVELNFAVFKTDRQNAGYAWSPNTVSATQLEALFNPNNILPADPKYFHVETGLNNEAREVNSQEQSKGIEVTLNANLGGLRARVNFAKIKVQSTRDFSDFKTLLDAAIARTTAANAPGGDRLMAENATDIANALDILAQNTNTTLVLGRRSAPFTGSFAFDYTLRQVTGLRLGLTGTWTPAYNLAIVNGVTYKGGAALPLSVYATYDRKVFGYRTTFRLGFSRIYDVLQGDSRYYKTGSNSVNAATSKPNYLYRYTEPMTSNLSVTVRF